MPLDLVGVSDIAAMLAVTRQRADKITRDYPDFPPPSAVTSAGRVWLRSDVEAWIAGHPERPPGRPKR